MYPLRPVQFSPRTRPSSQTKPRARTGGGGVSGGPWLVRCGVVGFLDSPACISGCILRCMILGSHSKHIARAAV